MCLSTDYGFIQKLVLSYLLYTTWTNALLNSCLFRTVRKKVPFRSKLISEKHEKGKIETSSDASVATDRTFSTSDTTQGKDQPSSDDISSQNDLFSEVLLPAKQGSYVAFSDIVKNLSNQTSITVYHRVLVEKISRKFNIPNQGGSTYR